MPSNKEGYYHKLKADEMKLCEQAQMIRAERSLKEARMLNDIQMTEDKLIWMASLDVVNESLFASTIHELHHKTKQFVHFKPANP